MLFAATLSAAEFRYEARHDHLRKGGNGTLVIGDDGVSFQEAGKKGKPSKHAWQWRFEDIQQLELAPRTLRVLTYKDARWKLGADREYRFDLVQDGSFSGAYDFLKGRMDQRLVAELADKEVEAIFEIPAKHLLRFGGTHGVLAFGRDRIVYSTDRKGESRTWRFADIENISSNGPFQLTVTTHERALAHYGSLKGFNFQLKEPLREEQFNSMWRRINESKGLQVLTSYQERNYNQ